MERRGRSGCPTVQWG